MPVVRDPLYGCELWTGRTDRDGYGMHNRRRAHTIAWEAEHGPVPEGLVLDHTCKVRRCCAVHHLEAVTQSVNLARKTWRGQVNRKHCAKGHDLSIHAIPMPHTGGRVCRQCNREAARDGQ